MSSDDRPEIDPSPVDPAETARETALANAVAAKKKKRKIRREKSSHSEKTAKARQRLAEVLESGRAFSVRQTMASMQAAELANALESLPTRKRLLAWELLDGEHAGEVLAELNEEARDALIEQSESEDLLDAIRGMEVDDVADLIQSLPDTLIPEVLAGMTSRTATGSSRAELARGQRRRLDGPRRGHRAR